MKKPTIISGPVCSGKSWIADAIANQFDEKRVIRTHPQNVIELIFLNGQIKNLDYSHDLIIIQECTLDDILKIHDLKPFKSRRINFWSGDYYEELERDSNIGVVYLTQEDALPKNFKEFHVINCNNRIV